MPKQASALEEYACEFLRIEQQEVSLAQEIQLGNACGVQGIQLGNAFEVQETPLEQISVVLLLPPVEMQAKKASEALGILVA